MALKDMRGQAARRTPDELVKHLKTFELDLRFSAGVWFFAPGGGRFHDRYVDEMPMEQVLETAAELKEYGLSGLEAHYPNEVNDKTLPLFKALQEQVGIRLVTVVPNLFFESQFEFGALSSPLPEVHERAVRRAIEAFQINKELDTDFAIVWPGIDGYENPFGIDLVAARDRFCAGLAEAMDTVPGVRVAEEPKPYEPRGHILYGTTAEGLLMGMKTEGMLKHADNAALLEAGHAMVGLNPEVGHVLMGYEDLPYAFGLAMDRALLPSLSGSQNGELVCRAADLSRPPGDMGPFDGAIITDVLEHTTDPEAVVRNVSALLRPGARLLVTVPTDANGIAQREREEEHGYTFPFLLHIEFFSDGRIERIAAAAGMTVEKIVPFSHDKTTPGETVPMEVMAVLKKK